MFVTAIIAAGGRGERFGGAQPKQLLSIGGRTILERSVDCIPDAPVDRRRRRGAAEGTGGSIRPPYLTSARQTVADRRGWSRDARIPSPQRFGAVSDRTEIVVVHDAARPFVSADLIERTIAAAAESGAALAAVASRDTVKQVRDHVVRATLDRRTIFLAQTPQAFRRDVLARRTCARRWPRDATDEASLAEQAGHAVRIVEGEASNIKITTPDDLVDCRGDRAGAIGRAGKRARTGRAGIGYDLHRLVEGRPLHPWRSDHSVRSRAWLGHSDADAVCHAVTDAILGAAGCRRHRPAFSRLRFAMEGRLEHRSLESGGRRSSASRGSKWAMWTPP